MIDSIEDDSVVSDSILTVNAVLETTEDAKETVKTTISVTKESTEKKASGAVGLTDNATKAIVSKIEKTVEAAVALLELKGEEHISAPTVLVELADATVISSDIFKAAKGSDVNLVLKMDGYSWKINGKSITDAKELNLEVKKDTTNVPKTIVEQLAGNKPSTQLSLTHNGEFGFTGVLCLELDTLGKAHVGEYANLYYYNDKQELVFQNAGIIKEDGTVELVFSHASEYVLVIDKKAAATPAPAPQTGDSAPILPLVAILFVGAAGVGYAVRRGKRA